MFAHMLVLGMVLAMTGKGFAQSPAAGDTKPVKMVVLGIP